MESQSLKPLHNLTTKFQILDYFLSQTPTAFEEEKKPQNTTEKSQHKV